MKSAALALISVLVCLSSPAFSEDLPSLQSRLEQAQDGVDLMDNLTPDELAQLMGLSDEEEAIIEPAAAAGQLVIRVSLASQKIYVDSDNESFVAHVSTGRKGYGTVTGCYRPKHLARMHYSKKYDNAPMPNSVFFHGGYAIHATYATSLLGSRASHGCVRVSPATSKKIFSLVKSYGSANTTICVN